MSDKPNETEADVMLGLKMEDWEWFLGCIEAASSGMVNANCKSRVPIAAEWNAVHDRIRRLWFHLNNQYRRQRAALGKTGPG